MTPMLDRIDVKPDVCNGKAVIKGTRITVSTILGYMAAGDSVDDIIEGYPHLNHEDILACLEYAKQITEGHSTLKQLA